MADTSIEWTDRVWNPTRGCSLKSPGCKNCYAMKMAHRFSGKGQPYEGLTELGPNGPRWTGKVSSVPEMLGTPLKWKKPARIFVNSMSDLFHDEVPDNFIDQVFAVMAVSLRHTYQVLTKRPERMQKYFADPETQGRVAAIVGEILELMACKLGAWPLPNVWLGVSVENQEAADERIPHLLNTPAAVRFLSVEPLLGPVSLRPYFHGMGALVNVRPPIVTPKIDWVIVGGESGPGARPMHPEWARSLRDQCEAANVPFLFKQWGEWKPTGSVDCFSHGPKRIEREFPNSPGISWLADGRICLKDFTVAEHAERRRARIATSNRAIEVDQKALDDWHDTCQRIDKEERQGCRYTGPIPVLGYQWMYRVGKKVSGRLLDGIEHNGYPEVKS